VLFDILCAEPKCRQIQFWCLFFHNKGIFLKHARKNRNPNNESKSKVSEDGGGRNREVPSCGAPLHEQTPSLSTLPTSKARAHSLPWLPLPSCLSPPQCLQNPNFEIMKLCIVIPLHISSPPFHCVFRLLNASKTLILRF